MNRGTSLSCLDIGREVYTPMPKKNREKLIFLCCLCVIYVKSDCHSQCIQYGHTVKSLTTWNSEHITMCNVPVCESQCVLCRPWKSVWIGSRVADFICAIDGFHGWSHWGQRWRELTSWRLLNVKKKISAVTVLRHQLVLKYFTQLIICCTVSHK